MRDCYDLFYSDEEWPGQGDPLEDPWLEPSSVDIALRAHVLTEEELQRQEDRRLLLQVALADAGKPEVPSRSGTPLSRVSRASSASPGGAARRGSSPASARSGLGSSRQHGARGPSLSHSASWQADLRHGRDEVPTAAVVRLAGQAAGVLQRGCLWANHGVSALFVR